MRGIGGRDVDLVDKRELLLDAAERAFCRLGYARTTMASLAAEAQITRPTVYSYFPSKDDVFRALADRVRREFLSIQERASSPSPMQTIMNSLVAYLEAMTRHREMLTIIAHEALTDPTMAALRSEIFDRVNGRNSRYVRRLAAEGIAKPVVDPEVIGEALSGITLRFAELVGADPGSRQRFSAQLVELYLSMTGVRREEADSR